MPVSLLAELDPAAHPRWARVIRELRRHLAEHRAHEAEADGATAPDDAGGADDAGGTDADDSADLDLRRRRPRADLRRRVLARDRGCVAPHCGSLATDIDHTHDHALGGLTTETNSGGACHHHNRLKTETSWRVVQPVSGTFRWVSRAGATYTTTAPPVIPPRVVDDRTSGETAEQPCRSTPGPWPVHLARDAGDPSGTTSSAWIRHPDTYRDRPPERADDPLAPWRAPPRRTQRPVYPASDDPPF